MFQHRWLEEVTQVVEAAEAVIQVVEVEEVVEVGTQEEDLLRPATEYLPARRLCLRPATEHPPEGSEVEAGAAQLLPRPTERPLSAAVTEATAAEVGQVLSF